MAIGQKLEEARNRKGISLREASESTKIRGDYLSAFESSNFEINLPEVYLRGFVRLYARFLDLDQDSIVADLDVELGNGNNKSSKISLGSISSNESDVESSKSSNIQNHGAVNLQSNFKKPVLIVGGALIFALILIFFILFNSPTGKENIDQNTDQVDPISNVKEIERQTSSTNDISTETFTLRLAAIGPIELLIVDDRGDESPKDFKNLSAGWEYTAEIKGSFRCHCSSLENLRFSIDDGTEKKIDGAGAGNFSWQP